MKKRIALVLSGLIILVFFSTGYSQVHVDILKIGYAQSISAPSGYDQNDLYANLLVPIPLKETFVVLTGVNHNSISTTRNDTSINLSQTTALFGFKADIGEKFSITAVSLHRFNQVIDPWNRVQYQPGGIFLLTRKVSESFKYNIGLYYNTENSGAFYIPVLGIDWKPSDKLQIKGNMPINLKVLYAPSNAIKVGFSYVGKYSTFKLSSNYIVLNRNEFALFLEYAIIKNVIIQAGPSFSLGNTNKFFAKNDKVKASVDGFHLNDKRILLDNYEMNNSLFFDIKLIYRVFK